MRERERGKTAFVSTGRKGIEKHGFSYHIQILYSLFHSTTKKKKKKKKNERRHRCQIIPEINQV